MKYLNEFRCHTLAKKLASAIQQQADPSHVYRLLEFCGGHTHAIFRHGIQDLLPDNVRFIHGPGCPVCVLPSGRLDSLMNLVERYDPIVCTYGDVLRVPASAGKTLHQLRARGADIRIVYSSLDALKVARENPQHQVVFFAIGFETTTPPTAVAIQQARRDSLHNFTVMCNHVITPAALQALLNVEAGQTLQFNGILGPSHVSTVTGYGMYQPFTQRYLMPIVVAGFEPLDVMQSALMLIRQINEGRCEVENEYTRAVNLEGNRKAQQLIREVFELRDSFEWRGLGKLPHSALRIRERYAEFDAEQRFDIVEMSGSEIKGCQCPAVLRGQLEPEDCKLFGKVCRPDNPKGACMVSSEGACAAHWLYRRGEFTKARSI